MPSSDSPYQSATNNVSGRLLFGGSVVLLVASQIFGGGPGDIGETALQLLALGLLPWALPTAWKRTGIALDQRIILCLLGAVIVLVLWQLIPWPAALWQQLPARAAYADELLVAGLPPTAHVLSLTPHATEATLWALLPPAALLVAALALPWQSRLRLLDVVLAMAAISVLLGFFQIAGGADSALRLHAFNNGTGTLGFFANRNHHAALLYMALPLAAWRFGTARLPLARVTLGGLLLLLILGLALTFSRAGIALGMLGALLAVPLLIGDRQQPWARRIPLLLGTLALAAVVQYALYGILQRLDADPLDDLRWTLFENTRALAAMYAPVGSGLGSFVQAYASDAPTSQLIASYVNHAHNDWAELYLEAGAIGLGLAIVWVGWLLRTGWRARRRAATQRDARAIHAAMIALLLVLLHSLVDYPLRTPAIATIAVLCVAWLSGARGAAKATLPVGGSDDVAAPPRHGGSAASTARPHHTPSPTSPTWAADQPSPW